jgi:alkane 1-monooxygenase
MHPLAYLTALLPAALAIPGLILGGAWAWLTPAFVFGLVPVLDQVLPRAARAEPPPRAAWARATAELALLASVPALLGPLALLLWRAPALDAIGLVGSVVSVGILCGVYGLNVAHELGHRRGRVGRHLAVLLMSTSLYGHFWVEHNLGHHVHVATPRDPASADRGDVLYPFWIRSIVGGARSALALSPRLVLGVWAAQALAVVAALALLGPLSALAWVGAAAVGVLLLETVNYVEHYGLRRRPLPDGRFERVAPRHSWNAEHVAGRALLFDLPRHSDHHANAQRACVALRRFDEAPQLPLGYPAMILLALAPPLFRAIVHPALDRAAATAEGAPAK